MVCARIGCMAKQVLGDANSRTSAAKFVKRPHSDDDDTTVKPMDSGSHQSTDSAASKRSRDVAAAVGLRRIKSLTLHTRVDNCYTVTRSEMMAFFSLLGELFDLVLSVCRLGGEGRCIGLRACFRCINVLTVD